MEVVKYHNDINKIKLGTLAEKELDIFFSLLFKLKDNETDTISLELKELKALANTSSRSNKRLISQIENFSSKLLKLNQRMELPTGEIVLFNLFRTFKINPNNNILIVSINEDFQYMLNDILNNFTYFSLKQLVNLKSGYSKNCFKLLKQFQSTRNFIIELEEFKKLLGVPDDYPTRNLNLRVLTPIIKELTPIFNNLKLEKLTRNKQLVGRGKKTHYLKFTWEKDPIKVKEIKQKKVKEVIKYKHEQEPIREVQEQSEVDKLKARVMSLEIESKQKIKLLTEIGNLEDIEKITEIIGKYTKVSLIK